MVCFSQEFQIYMFKCISYNYNLSGCYIAYTPYTRPFTYAARQQLHVYVVYHAYMKLEKTRKIIIRGEARATMLQLQFIMGQNCIFLSSALVSIFFHLFRFCTNAMK